MGQARLFAVCGILLVFLISCENSRSHPQDSRPFDLSAQQHVQQIADGLPQYSLLRISLEEGSHGSGEKQQYMDSMKRLVVKRAHFEVEGSWQHGQPKNLQIALRMYFDNYDGPHTRITDAQRLGEIRKSGLQDELDRVAIQRAEQARPFVVDGPLPFKNGDRVYAGVELYDDPWLWEPPALLFGSRLPALEWRATVGDTLGVAELLSHQSLTSEELNHALWSAVQSERDNTEVIDQLLRAGADVNAPRGSETPLMMALGYPVHVAFLLKAGARVDDRDDNRRTAIQQVEYSLRFFPSDPRLKYTLQVLMAARAS